jgi:hypothetical protein
MAKIENRKSKTENRKLPIHTVTTTELCIDEILYEPDASPQLVTEVLSKLDRWSDRTADHVTHLRSSTRHDYRVPVLVERCEVTPSGEPPARQILSVQSRNLSKNGMGLIAAPVYLPRLISDEHPLLRAETVFRVGAAFKITLAPHSKLPPVSGVVMRLRQVHFGFYDVGVQFVGREESPADETGHSLAEV